jgi:excisionase family DNA binding protein
LVRINAREADALWLSIFSILLYIDQMKSTALIERPASEREADQARRALQALRDGKPITGEAAAPAAATAAMERVLETMAEGGAVAIIALDAEITTQEAADLLGVSRPTLVKSLEDGALPFRVLGAHRRLKASDVLAYRDRRRVAQETALDTLVAENQRAGLYDD